MHITSYCLQLCPHNYKKKKKSSSLTGEKIYDGRNAARSRLMSRERERESAV